MAIELTLEDFDGKLYVLEEQENLLCWIKTFY